VIHLGVVMPVGQGRTDNVSMAMNYIFRAEDPIETVVAVLDGQEVEEPRFKHEKFHYLRIDKHEPGMEQPRNLGVRELIRIDPEVTHVAFLDSDVMVGHKWRTAIEEAYEVGTPGRIMVCPYDWLPAGYRNINPRLRNDPRWPMFDRISPQMSMTGDIGAGLACFSGNLVWPIDEFMRVGGFWSELHHGRCEDGELGLRAVSMGVPISFASQARGWHLWHKVNTPVVLERNKRDVPMLNTRHPWVQQSGVILVDRDGAAFDVLCPGCKQMVPTSIWWAHFVSCAVPPIIPIKEVPNG